MDTTTTPKDLGIEIIEIRPDLSLSNQERQIRDRLYSSLKVEELAEGSGGRELLSLTLD